MVYLLEMVIFHGDLLNNQMVYTKLTIPNWGAARLKAWRKSMEVGIQIQHFFVNLKTNQQQLANLKVETHTVRSDTLW